MKYYINGEVKEFTRLRRFCLHKEQEMLIKRTRDRSTLKSWKIKYKKQLKFLSNYYNPEKKHAICARSEFGKHKIVKDPGFKFVDILHRFYEKYDPETGRRSTWNNEFNKRLSDIAREYFSLLIQPEGATMLKLSMIEIGREFRRRGWDPRKDASIIFEAHDEIGCLARKELSQQVKKIMEECMMRVAKYSIRSIPTPVDVKIASNWGAAK